MVEHHLTPKQKKLLEFISSYQERKGYAPSQHEIARHFGFSSLGTVQNYLVRLERQGLLQKSPNAHRGMKVLSPTTTHGEGSVDETTEQMAEMEENGSADSRSFPSVIELPLVGKVAAGRPIEAVQRQETLEVPLSLLGRTQLGADGLPTVEHMVLKIQGDSMIEDGILDGDFVIVRKQGTAHNGQTVVALVNNEATIKRFYRKGPRVELHAANPNYDPILVESLTEGSVGIPDFRIEGVLVGVIRRVE
ncbi:MAG TPA: transcriptional repressor LexA [Bdellovibrionota bacterium]|jgi:repressor LexA|nr:transcriptional repressor LexA [Bdellovibrionota bacterium]